jgi:WhiB family redox-sensing transcriptional regulator
MFWSEGACRDLPAEWFHPERGGSTREAKAVCATCTVRVDCLTFALDNHEKFGIWGGTSERERRRIRRRMAAGQPVPQLDPEIPMVRAMPPPPPPPHRSPVLLRSVPTTKEPAVDLVTAPAPPTRPTNGSRPTDPNTGLPTDACVNCGKRYTPKRRDQRFHSKECARAWYAAHPRGESGKREPRVRKTRAARTVRAAAPAAVPVAAAPSAGSSSPEIHQLLGQLLAACNRWAIEADLGDIRISVTRSCG